MEPRPKPHNPKDPRRPGADRAKPDGKRLTRDQKKALAKEEERIIAEAAARIPEETSGAGVAKGSGVKAAVKCGAGAVKKPKKEIETQKNADAKISEVGARITATQTKGVSEEVEGKEEEEERVTAAVAADLSRLSVEEVAGELGAGSAKQPEAATEEGADGDDGDECVPRQLELRERQGAISKNKPKTVARTQSRLAAEAGDGPVRVKISNGTKIRGILRSDANSRDGQEPGKKYFAFLQIPIAKFKRFQAAEDVEWRLTGETDCSKTLPEGKKIGDLKHASVSIYTKSIPDTSVVGKKFRPVPVMVFVPGEPAMCDHDPTAFYGPQFLLRENVVVVIVTYRTGILGNLKTLYSCGEQGLSDLVKCLTWVKGEIEHFGGDKKNITCFGQGEGAAALWTISLSTFETGKVAAETAKRTGDISGRGRKTQWIEEEEKLYHKLILQSSTALCRQWVNKLTAEEFCHHTSTARFPNPSGNAFQELNRMGIEEIREREKHIPMKPLYRIIDYNEIVNLEEDPYFKPQQIPVLIGFNSNEYFYDKLNYNEIDHNKDQPLHSLGHDDIREEDYSEFYQFIDRDGPAKEIKAEFYNNESATQEKFEQVTQDLHHNISVLCQAKELAIRMHPNRVYLYRFDGDTELNLYKSQIKGKKAPGATYGDELGYLFKTPKTPKIRKGSKEEVLRDMMVTMWTNFAREGNPVAGTGKAELKVLPKWKYIKIEPFEDKTKIKKYVPVSICGAAIKDDSVEGQVLPLLPEVERMQHWWRILLGGKNWLEQ